MAGKSGHRGFGHVRKLPSGRYHASYVGPTPSADLLFGEHAQRWLSRRVLKPRTREHYGKLRTIESHHDQLDESRNWRSWSEMAHPRFDGRSPALRPSRRRTDSCDILRHCAPE